MSTPAEIVVDPVIRGLFPPLTDGERANLRDLLKLEGFREELVVWSQGNVLLDGHARHELATELGIEPRVRVIDLPDREAAIQFVIARQLGRRTLGRLATAYFIGKLYESVKRQGRRTDLLTSRQSDEKWADERVAEQYGVSPRTVSRNAELAAALDALGDENFFKADFRALVLAGRVRLTRQQIIWLANGDRSEARRWWERNKDEEPAARPKGGTARTDGDAADRGGRHAPPVAEGGLCRPAASTADDPTPAPDTARSPAADSAVTEPTLTRPARPVTSRAFDAGASAQDDPAAEAEEQPDLAVLRRMYALWQAASQVTRLAFVGQAAVQAAVSRKDEVIAAAAKAGVLS